MEVRVSEIDEDLLRVAFFVSTVGFLAIFDLNLIDHTKLLEFIQALFYGTPNVGLQINNTTLLSTAGDRVAFVSTLGPMEAVPYTMFYIPVCTAYTRRSRSISER